MTTALKVSEIAGAVFAATQKLNFDLSRRDDPVPGFAPIAGIYESQSQEYRDGIEDMVRGVITGEYDSAQDIHEKWIMDRREAGWVYGEKLDRRMMVHPLLLPWKVLTPLEQVRGEMAFAIVSSIVNSGVDIEGYVADGEADEPANDVDDESKPGAGAVG